MASSAFTTPLNPCQGGRENEEVPRDFGLNQEKPLKKLRIMLEADRVESSLGALI